MQSAEYVVHVNFEVDYPVDPAIIEAAGQAALAAADAPAPAALTVTLTSSEHIQALNQQFAGMAEPTDVLSFGAEENAYATEPGEPPYLGDVVIAYPVAQAQAAEREISVLKELQTLTVHGVLHLLGYDHASPDQQAEMWAYESSALNTLHSGADIG